MQLLSFFFYFLSCADNIFNKNYTFIYILLPSTTARSNNRRFVTRTSQVRASFFIVSKGYSILTVARLGVACDAIISVQCFGKIGQQIRKLNWRYVHSMAIVLSFVKEGKYAI